jgi:hypothetical protein
LREERIPNAPPNPYRPEASRREVERMGRDNVQEYSADRHESPPENPTGVYKIETNASGTETETDIVTSELLSKLEEVDGRLEPTVEYAEAIVENPTQSENEAPTGRTPELYESYELPVKDIESLLNELDAMPLENQIETGQRLESVENAERPL